MVFPKRGHLQGVYIKHAGFGNRQRLTMKRGWVVSTDYRAVIEGIKQARIDLDVGQRELARRLNKHPSFVNKIENLERRMDILEFIAIAQALGLTPEVLIGKATVGLPNRIEL